MGRRTKLGKADQSYTRFGANAGVYSVFTSTLATAAAARGRQILR
jgi:hypothetical protein